MRRILLQWSVATAALYLLPSSLAQQQATRLRRERYVYEIPDDAVITTTTTRKESLEESSIGWNAAEDQVLLRLLEDSSSFSFSMSMSMPSAPSPSPPSPTSASMSRDEEIMLKCGVTAEERSAEILRIVSSVSDTLDVARRMAVDWIDNKDEGLLCTDDDKRFTQRYVMAVIYYQLNGANWNMCRAKEDGGTCEMERGSTRWLGAANECMWYGSDCINSSESGGPPSVDDYFPLSLLELPENGLAGELPDELYSLTELIILTLDGNKRITGTIPSAIGNMKMLRFLDIDDNQLAGNMPEELFSLTRLQVLDLNSNKFSGPFPPSVGNLLDLRVLQIENNLINGPVPTDSLIKLEKLIALTMENNDMTGSVEAICDVIPERRETNNVSLTFFHVDCAGDPPMVECSCCRCF